MGEKPLTAIVLTDTFDENPLTTFKLTDQDGKPLDSCELAVFQENFCKLCIAGCGFNLLEGRFENYARCKGGIEEGGSCREVLKFDYSQLDF